MYCLYFYVTKNRRTHLVSVKCTETMLYYERQHKHRELLHSSVNYNMTDTHYRHTLYKPQSEFHRIKYVASSSFNRSDAFAISILPSEL